MAGGSLTSSEDRLSLIGGGLGRRPEITEHGEHSTVLDNTRHTAHTAVCGSRDLSSFFSTSSGLRCCADLLYLLPRWCMTQESPAAILYSRYHSDNGGAAPATCLWCALIRICDGGSSG